MSGCVTTSLAEPTPASPRQRPRQVGQALGADVHDERLDVGAVGGLDQDVDPAPDRDDVLLVHALRDELRIEVRVDAAQRLGERLDLRPAELVREVELAVEVALLDDVEVGEHEAPDAGAHEHHRGVAPEPAQRR